MRRLLFTLLFFTLSSTIYSQEGFNYKAVIYDNNIPLQNQSVDIRFTILENGVTEIYQETQSSNTDANGIVILSIGEGSVLNGDFNTIDWTTSPFLKVEIDYGSGYVDMGTSSFYYVPLAKYAEKAGNTFSGDYNDLTNIPNDIADGDNDTQLTEVQVDSYVANNGFISSEVDGDVTNELQTITKTGNTVTLSNGGGSFTDANTQLSEAQVDTYTSNNGYISSEVDGDVTNELQTLSLTGNVLNISNGNNVTLPQNTYYEGTGIQINPGNVISNSGDADADPTNELQTITKSGNIVSLSNSGGSFTDSDTHLTEAQVDAYTSNNGYISTEIDGDVTNELQTLSVSGNVLTISNGNNITLPSSPASSDVDFLEVGTGSAPNNILDNIYHTGNISVGHSTVPNAKMDIKNTGSSTASNANTGIKIINNNSSNTTKIGVNTSIDGAGTALVYGTKNSILDISDGDIYGTHTSIGGFNGNGDHYGNYLSLTGEGYGVHTGSKVTLYTNGTAEQVGTDIELYTIVNSNTAIQTGIKTHVYGEGTGNKFGITNLLDGTANGNLYGVENTVSNTNNYSHYGTINRMSGTGSGGHYATSNILSGTGVGTQYGVRNYINNSGNNFHFGTYSKLLGTGSGQHFGAINLLQGSGNGRQTGVSNEISNTGTSTHYGVKNTLSGTGTGIHYGIYSALTGTGTGSQTGAYYLISNTGIGTHTGVKTQLNGSATSTQVGFETVINNTGNGYQFGVSSIVDNSGNGTHTGVAARMSGTGSGTQYGNRITLNNSGDGTHYGSYHSISGTGSGTKYGVYSIITSSAGGSNQYAIYGEASTTSLNQYAGYFKGRTRVDGFLRSTSFQTGQIYNDGETYRRPDNADMVAYIYGNIQAHSIPVLVNIIAASSTDGFNVTRLSAGRYQITSSLNSSTGFIVDATLSSQGIIWVDSRTSNSFVVNIKDGFGNGDWADLNFQFVVFKK